ncbi:Lrp/AsnC family transcriptional regulator [Candidatus Thorarchaeota archaeon]|nr:MAG: Lrp/AsnC family transcriptional regulator [Candidatus Thorarchaeota archaeon]
MSENISTEMDEVDRQLLTILQRDGKTTISDMSKAVGKGISTVHSRLKRLEEEGVIKRYTAVVDAKKMGRPTLGFILVRVRYRIPGKTEMVSQRDFCKEISLHPFVQEVHVVSGEWDVLLKVRTPGVEEMNSFIVDFLREIPSVDRTITMFSMDTYLETTELRPMTDVAYEKH